MIILAHRANLNGPQPGRDNRLEDTSRALELGFGLETDLRRDPNGRFYISHDPKPSAEGRDFNAFAEVFRRYPDRTLAVNAKELGYEQELVELVYSGALGQKAFFFDFELLEPSTPGGAQRKIKSLPGGASVALASRLSDRGELLAQCLSIPGEVVWADEFDSFWLGPQEIEAAKHAGRKIYAISPELHGFPVKTMRQRWTDFKNWGVDGVCTDYALAAGEFFNT